jgi:hypothetical protein
MVKIMILYHPAKDINHCIYRMITILLNCESEISIDTLRLFDFYASFPHLIITISPWPQDIKKFKVYISKIPKPFEVISNRRRLFFDMADVQKSAITTLFSKGTLDIVSYSNGMITLDKKSIPQGLVTSIKQNKLINSDVLKVLTEGLLQTEWEGTKGLKARSGLLEYKYD